MSTRRAFFNSKMFLISHCVPADGGDCLRPGVEPLSTKLGSVTVLAAFTPAGVRPYTTYSVAFGTASHDIFTAPPLTVALTSSDGTDDASFPCPAGRRATTRYV